MSSLRELVETLLLPQLALQTTSVRQLLSKCVSDYDKGGSNDLSASQHYRALLQLVIGRWDLVELEPSPNKKTSLDRQLSSSTPTAEQRLGGQFTPLAVSSLCVDALATLLERGYVSPRQLTQDLTAMFCDIHPSTSLPALVRLLVRALELTERTVATGARTRREKSDGGLNETNSSATNSLLCMLLQAVPHSYRAVLQVLREVCWDVPLSFDLFALAASASSASASSSSLSLHPPSLRRRIALFLPFLCAALHNVSIRSAVHASVVATASDARCAWSLTKELLFLLTRMACTTRLSSRSSLLSSSGAVFDALAWDHSLAALSALSPCFLHAHLHHPPSSSSHISSSSLPSASASSSHHNRHFQFAKKGALATAFAYLSLCVASVQLSSRADEGGGQGGGAGMLLAQAVTGLNSLCRLTLSSSSSLFSSTFSLYTHLDVVFVVGWCLLHSELTHSRQDRSACVHMLHRCLTAMQTALHRRGSRGEERGSMRACMGLVLAALVSFHSSLPSMPVSSPSSASSSSPSSPSSSLALLRQVTSQCTALATALRAASFNTHSSIEQPDAGDGEEEEEEEEEGGEPGCDGRPALCLQRPSSRLFCDAAVWHVLSLHDGLARAFTIKGGCFATLAAKAVTSGEEGKRTPTEVLKAVFPALSGPPASLATAAKESWSEDVLTQAACLLCHPSPSVVVGTLALLTAFAPVHALLVSRLLPLLLYRLASHATPTGKELPPLVSLSVLRCLSSLAAQAALIPIIVRSISSFSSPALRPTCITLHADMYAANYRYFPGLLKVLTAAASAPPSSSTTTPLSSFSPSPSPAVQVAVTACLLKVCAGTRGFSHGAQCLPLIQLSLAFSSSSSSSFPSASSSFSSLATSSVGLALTALSMALRCLHLLVDCRAITFASAYAIYQRRVLEREGGGSNEGMTSLMTPASFSTLFASSYSSSSSSATPSPCLTAHHLQAVTAMLLLLSSGAQVRGEAESVGLNKNTNNQQLSRLHQVRILFAYATVQAPLSSAPTSSSSASPSLFTSSPFSSWLVAVAHMREAAWRGVLAYICESQITSSPMTSKDSSSSSGQEEADVDRAAVLAWAYSDEVKEQVFAMVKLAIGERKQEHEDAGELRLVNGVPTLVHPPAAAPTPLLGSSSATAALVGGGGKGWLFILLEVARILMEAELSPSQAQIRFDAVAAASSSSSSSCSSFPLLPAFVAPSLDPLAYFASLSSSSSSLASLSPLSSPTQLALRSFLCDRMLKNHIPTLYASNLRPVLTETLAVAMLFTPPPPLYSSSTVRPSSRGKGQSTAHGGGAAQGWTASALSAHFQASLRDLLRNVRAKHWHGQAMLVRGWMIFTERALEAVTAGLLAEREIKKEGSQKGKQEDLNSLTWQAHSILQGVMSPTSVDLSIPLVRSNVLLVEACLACLMNVSRQRGGSAVSGASKARDLALSLFTASATCLNMTTATSTSAATATSVSSLHTQHQLIQEENLEARCFALSLLVAHHLSSDITVLNRCVKELGDAGARLVAMEEREEKKVRKEERTGEEKKEKREEVKIERSKMDAKAPLLLFSCLASMGSCVQAVFATDSTDALEADSTDAIEADANSALVNGDVQKEALGGRGKGGELLELEKSLTSLMMEEGSGNYTAFGEGLANDQEGTTSHQKGITSHGCLPGAGRMGVRSGFSGDVEGGTQGWMSEVVQTLATSLSATLQTLRCLPASPSPSPSTFLTTTTSTTGSATNGGFPFTAELPRFVWELEGGKNAAKQGVDVSPLQAYRLLGTVTGLSLCFPALVLTKQLPCLLSLHRLFLSFFSSLSTASACTVGGAVSSPQPVVRDALAVCWSRLLWALYGLNVVSQQEIQVYARILCQHVLGIASSASSPSPFSSLSSLGGAACCNAVCLLLARLNRAGVQVWEEEGKEGEEGEDENGGRKGYYVIFAQTTLSASDKAGVKGRGGVVGGGEEGEEGGRREECCVACMLGLLFVDPSIVPLSTTAAPCSLFRTVPPLSTAAITAAGAAEGLPQQLIQRLATYVEGGRKDVSPKAIAISVGGMALLSASVLYSLRRKLAGEADKSRGESNSGAQLCRIPKHCLLSRLFHAWLATSVSVLARPSSSFRQPSAPQQMEDAKRMLLCLAHILTPIPISSLVPVASSSSISYIGRHLHIADVTFIDVFRCTAFFVSTVKEEGGRNLSSPSLNDEVRLLALHCSLHRLAKGGQGAPALLRFLAYLLSPAAFLRLAIPLQLLLLTRGLAVVWGSMGSVGLSSLLTPLLPAIIRASARTTSSHDPTAGIAQEKVQCAMFSALTALCQSTRVGKADPERGLDEDREGGSLVLSNIFSLLQGEVNAAMAASSSSSSHVSGSVIEAYTVCFVTYYQYYHEQNASPSAAALGTLFCIPDLSALDFDPSVCEPCQQLGSMQKLLSNSLVSFHFRCCLHKLFSSASSSTGSSSLSSSFLSSLCLALPLEPCRGLLSSLPLIFSSSLEQEVEGLFFSLTAALTRCTVCFSEAQRRDWLLFYIRRIAASLSSAASAAAVCSSAAAVFVSPLVPLSLLRAACMMWTSGRTDVDSHSGTLLQGNILRSMAGLPALLCLVVQAMGGGSKQSVVSLDATSNDVGFTSDYNTHALVIVEALALACQLCNDGGRRRGGVAGNRKQHCAEEPDAIVVAEEDMRETDRQLAKGALLGCLQGLKGLPGLRTGHPTTSHESTTSYSSSNNNRREEGVWNNLVSALTGVLV